VKLIFLAFGILLVALAFDRSRALGSALLAIVVLSLLITAQKERVI